MSNERIDEFLSWRGRLDDPQGVPGQELDDREATWERLMDKIGETGRRRRFFGYRLAVACALLALIPTVRFFQDRHPRTVSLRPAALKRVVTPAPSPMPVMPMPAPVATAPSPHHPAGTIPTPAVTASAGSIWTERDGREQSGKQLSKRAREQPLQLAGLPAVPVTVTVTPPGPGTGQLDIKPLKNKPLRVVHINELPGSSAPSPAVTVSDATRNFEFFPAPALLKVKLSSPN